MLLINTLTFNYCLVILHLQILRTAFDIAERRGGKSYLKRPIQSVERAFNVLELFDANQTELSIKEISAMLELPKSTVHGLVRTLHYRGYLSQNSSTQKYSLGLRLFELGSLVKIKSGIIKIALPYIHDLVAKINETVHLVILDGHEALYIEKVEGTQGLRMYSQVGKRAPLHCTGVGKGLLAFMDEEERDNILSSIPLKAFTEKTITNLPELIENLNGARENGYAVDDEEIEIGLKCIAAPIYNYNNDVMASISCAGPKARINSKEDIIISEVKKMANEISMKMRHLGS